MLLRVAVLGAAAVLAAGCSSSENVDGPSESPAAEVSVFFTADDTAAVNAGYVDYPDAINTATHEDSVKRCNAMRTKADNLWVKCWTKLLEPVEVSLASTKKAVTEVAARDGLRPECAAELKATAQVIGDYRQDVLTLIQQLDGSAAARQNFSRQYYKSLSSGHAAMSEAFNAATLACYSPEELASASASPQSSP